MLVRLLARRRAVLIGVANGSLLDPEPLAREDGLCGRGHGNRNVVDSHAGQRLVTLPKCSALLLGEALLVCALGVGRVALAVPSLVHACLDGKSEKVLDDDADVLAHSFLGVKLGDWNRVEQERTPRNLGVTVEVVVDSLLMKGLSGQSPCALDVRVCKYATALGHGRTLKLVDAATNGYSAAELTARDAGSRSIGRGRVGGNRLLLVLLNDAGALRAALDS